MAKKENPFKEYDITTQAVHTGTDYDAALLHYMPYFGHCLSPVDLDQALKAVGL